VQKMCCIFKCLTGYVAGWIIFAANVAAAGCLLAGAFAPWLQYKGSFDTGVGTSVTADIYLASIGAGGTASGKFAGQDISLPTGVLITDISKFLIAANGVDSSIKWSTNDFNVLYLGAGAQVASAAFILVTILLNSLLCLCKMCCCCCPESQWLNVAISFAQTGVALIGVAASGASFTALDAAFKAVYNTKSTSLIASNIADCVTNFLTVEASKKVTCLIVGMNKEPAVTAGKGLGSLGVCLLAACFGLRVFQCFLNGCCSGKKAEADKAHASPAGGSKV